MNAEDHAAEIASERADDPSRRTGSPACDIDDLKANLVGAIDLVAKYR